MRIIDNYNVEDFLKYLKSDDIHLLQQTKMSMLVATCSFKVKYILYVEGIDESDHAIFHNNFNGNYDIHCLNTIIFLNNYDDYMFALVKWR